MNISPLDIKQKQFKLKFRGFDISEVDSFLEEITQEMEALVRENEALREENLEIKAQVAEFKEAEKELRNTLMAAQKMSEDWKSASERESQLRIKQAELEAEKIIQEARRKLAKTEEEIAELSRIKERFTLKVRGLIEDHLKMLSYEDREEGR
ncbi:MAG: DivIVA domain-containing protein [Nitrospirota bacterium]